ncbi:MAG: DUF1579 family protein [Saprospiraceae bacterium]|nr:DUF1579 family protein [Saprospiraceae bacterium]
MATAIGNSTVFYKPNIAEGYKLVEKSTIIMKYMKIIALCSLFFVTITSYAQMPPSKIAEVVAKVEALPIKPGEWAGKAWMQMGNERQEVDQYERITLLLDGAVILIEGTGKQGDQVVHHAVATLSYDPIKQAYQFQSFKDGYITSADCKLHEDGKFEWSMENPRGVTRYTIWLENGKWKETGAFSGDGGNTWYPFFEMELSKK